MDQLITPITPANPAAIHNAMSTHLRPHCGSRAVLPSTPIPLAPATPRSMTILKRRLIRGALLNTQVTPNTCHMPSLYYNPAALSLYVFNYNFYNNEDIINGDVSVEDIMFSYQTNR